MANQSFHTLLENKQYQLAAQLLVANQELLDEVMQDYLTKKLRVNQAISNVFEAFKGKHESLLHPYFSFWIEQLKSPHHDAFWRNSYRYFQDVEIPEEHRGLLYDLAFKDMVKAKSPIAIKAFAMKTCVNIAKHYPELLPELREAIEIVSNSESAGVRARSRHMIEAIDQLL